MGLLNFFARWRKKTVSPAPEEEKNDARPGESKESSGDDVRPEESKEVPAAPADKDEARPEENEEASSKDAFEGSAYDHAFMAEHFEGLGDIWEALLGQEAPKLAEKLPAIVKKSTCHEGCSVLFQDSGITVTLAQYPDNSRDIRTGILLASHPSQKGLVLFSCYPVMEGLPNPLRIRKCHPWTNMLEGVVAAERVHDGPPITFYAPFFFRDALRFVPGAELSVSLAGLAYSCRKAESQSFTVDEGPWYEEELQSFLENNPGKTEADFSAPVVSMQGARILLPLPSACNWQYRCPVLEATRTDVLGQPVYKLHVIFVGVDEANLAGYLYVPERQLNGYIPQAGDDIEGILWMTGMLHEDEEAG